MKSELTWLTKGLRPLPIIWPNDCWGGYLNWPDLRRDCDHPPIHSLDDKFPQIWIDLTYEGIATPGPQLDGFFALCIWIDLTYEGIATPGLHTHIPLIDSIWIDLTYEGIATSQPLAI